MENNYSQLKSEIKLTRKKILDLLEGILRNHESWIFIRSKILSSFGQNGLDGKVDEIFNTGKDIINDNTENN